MAKVHQRIARAIPECGHDVHLTQLGECSLIILYESGESVWQTFKASSREGLQIGLHLAALYDCELVEHHPYSNWDRSEAPENVL